MKLMIISSLKNLQLLLPISGDVKCIFIVVKYLMLTFYYHFCGAPARSGLLSTLGLTLNTLIPRMSVISSMMQMR